MLYKCIKQRSKEIETQVGWNKPICCHKTNAMPIKLFDCERNFPNGEAYQIYKEYPEINLK